MIAQLLLAAVLLAGAESLDQDPFRVLEDPTHPGTQAFHRAQAARTRAHLDAIPGRAALLERIRTLTGADTRVSAIAVTPTRTFYLKLGPGQRSAALHVRENLSGAERLLVDPARLGAGEGGAAIDWFAPAPDGRHVAYGVSHGGSGDSVLRVIAVDPARDLGVEIDRARFNARLAWHPDGRSFYYARVPEGARHHAGMRVYRHRLGRDAARNEIVFAPGVGGARGVPPFAQPALHLPLESRFAYALVRDGVGRDLQVHVALQRDLAAGKPQWRKLADFADGVLAAEGWRDDLYLLSRHAAPRHRVLRVRATARDLAAARVVVPEDEVVLQSMGLARDALYLRTMLGGVDRLERVALGGSAPRKPEFVRIPFDHAIRELVTHPRANGAILRLEGWIEPPKVVQVEARGGELRDLRIQPPSGADFSGIDEVRLYATAADGTRIPVTLVYRKSTRLTGVNPTLLVGYGAYGAVPDPSFDPARLAWLERGGVFAVAHVRGGGEYGEDWHESGRPAGKANTIGDFLAVAEFLLSYGFTHPLRLAIQGTGAGAIPVGAALARKPGIFAAAVARAPLADLLRYEAMEGGPASLPEFGTAATAEGARYLREISPYHQLAEGTAYPAVLVTAGANDRAVEPWQAAKLAARLQVASTSGKPVLLRIDPGAGHPAGPARARRDEELADIYAFLLWQLGDPQFAVPPPPG